MNDNLEPLLLLDENGEETEFEVITKLDIEEKDPIEIYLDGTSIILRKFETGCIFCNNAKELVSFKDKLVCKKCLSKINSLDIEEEYK